MSGSIQTDAVSFDAIPPVQHPGDTTRSLTPDAGGAAGSSVVIHGSSNVHVGSNITLVGGQRVARRSQPPASTPQLVALFRCGSILTEYQAHLASRFIGLAWRDLARRLRFLGAETDNFEFRAYSLPEISHRMLLAWRERESTAATVERLAKALWDVEAYDAVLKLAELAVE